jgi:Zn-dependent M28 family amino/carboxypeptidase
VLFVWFTGEEAGLLGSDYFAAHPLVPLERIAGAINLDAGAPPAPCLSWHIQGGDRSTLGALARDVARGAGWEAQVRPASPNSDHYPLLRAGVPAVFLVPAPGPFESLTTEASQALRRRWDRYHEPGDAWAPDYPFAGLARYADFALRLGLALAGGPAARMLTGR